MSSEPDDASIAYATSALARCGYRVERVPVSSTPRPDLIARLGTEVLTLEVKSNAAAELFLDDRGVAHVSTSLAFDNAVSRSVKKAARQLQAGPNGSLHVLCYVLGGVTAEAKLDQVRSTLYGLVDLIELGGAARAVPCFYFDRPEFFRQSGIAAALLLWERRGQLCLNEFCPDAAALRSTQLWRYHADAEAIRDPEAEERAGGAFAIREALVSNDERSRLSYVEAKYKRGRLECLRWQTHTGVGFTPAR